MVSDAGKPSGVAVVRHEPGRAAAVFGFPVHQGGRMPYLLRHAHAGNKRAWAGPDSTRPLSNAGRQRRGLRVESADVLGVDADPTDLVALLLDPATAEAVLCSHGELIGAALIRLVGERFEGDSLSWPKGSTWVLKVTEGRIEDARYLPPLRLEDAEAGYY